MHIISLGWPFTKETIRNNISCLPRARVSLSLIVCTECNQHFGCLAFILEKTHCCFLLSRVKVEVVVCTYCNQHRVVLAFISETILCFLSSRTKAQFVVCTHCNQHQDRLAECQSSISSPWIAQHIAKNTTEHTEPHCKEHTEPHCKEHTEPHCKEHTEHKTQQNTKNASTDCSTTLVSPFNNAECKGWIVSIIRCRTEPGNGRQGHWMGGFWSTPGSNTTNPRWGPYPTHPV